MTPARSPHDPRTRVATLAALIAVTLAALARPAAAIVIHTLPSRDGECFMLRPLDRDELYIANPLECRVRSAPASTFKIPHALIALESKAITPATVAKWDGRKQPFAGWQRHHTVESAIRGSVLWFFQRTAAEIGRERMSEWLQTIGYGDDAFHGDVTAFWVNGDLVISPEQKLDFLARLFTRQLRVSAGSVDAVMRAMTMPPHAITSAAGRHPFAIDWPAGAVVRAKTGNTTVDAWRVSWLVGQLESSGRTFVFVARVRSRGALPPTAGADAARRHLRAVSAAANR